LRIAGYLARVRSRGVSIRVFLAALVAAILLPALMLGAWLTVRSTASERDLLVRTSQSKASEVVADIEDDIAAAKATLTALASSQFLQNGDIEGFHRQSTEVAKYLGAQLALRDPRDGSQIMNSSVAWGQPLPGANPPQALDAMHESIRTGQLTISNVFFSPTLNKFVINIGLPVMKQNAVAYFLSVGVPLHTFADSLQGAALPPDWIVTLVDADNTIIARSDRSDLAGTRLYNPAVVKQIVEDGSGFATSRYGVRRLWVAHRSELTGWYALVGIPVSELEAPARRALIAYGAVGGTFFMLAMALALFFSDRVAQWFGEMGIDRTPTRDEFRTLFESAPNGVLVADAKGLIVLANDKLESQFGYSQGELVGRPVEMLVPEKFQGSHFAERETFSAAPEFRSMSAGRELHGRRKDGSEFRIEVGLNPIATSSGEFVMATIVDITARIVSEKRLRTALTERDDLRRRFMQAQESERLRLAHELHDQTGQTLTAALLELKSLESQLKDQERLRVRELRKSMEDMGKTLHRVAWELRPASIDELGLTSALANYVSEWGVQYGIEADFLCRDPRLDLIAEEKRTAIYRIVQEALTNVAKHARSATSVSVVVDRLDSVLRLTVEDNGPGIEGGMAEEPGFTSRGGLGLAGIRERLTLIGGELEIESTLGAGTTIFARIPLDSEKVIA
jgi:PAS domain S-box-containing protein